jgi:hypothetical protein
LKRTFKIISAFIFLFLFTFSGYSGNIASQDFFPLNEIIIAEEEGDVHFETSDSFSVNQLEHGSGGGDDTDDYHKTSSAGQALVISNLTAIVTYFSEQCLLNQYLLSLSNSVHQPALFILYSCRKDFLS